MRRNCSTTRLKSRRGTSMIETLVGLFVLVVMMTMMVRLSGVKLNEQDKLARQYAVLSVDGYFANIYSDFQECLSVDVQESPSGQVLLTFSMPEDKVSLYSFNSGDSGCYDDGTWQFKAVNMKAVKAANNLFVAIKLPDGNVFELDVYR